MDAEIQVNIGLDALRQIRGRAASLGDRHEAILGRFWDPERSTFSQVPADNEAHITSACTAVLSFIDSGVSRLPGYFDIDRFVTWLMEARWTSESLPENNEYTAPLALTTLALLSRTSMHEDKPRHVAQLLTDRLSDSEVGAIGSVSRSPHPPSGFLTYWTVRALAAVSDAIGHDASIGLERQEAALALSEAWATDETYRQLAYRGMGDSDRFDSLQLAYAVSLVDFVRERHSRRTDRMMVAKCLDVLFEAQLPNGMWPKLNPIFHYDKLGNVYPFSFEAIAEVMRIGLRAGRSEPNDFAVRIFSPHLAGLLRVLDWAETHEMRHGDVSGWRSNHTGPGSDPQVWATAMVLAFNRSLETLSKQMIQQRTLSELNTRYFGPPTAARSEDWTSLTDSDVQFRGTVLSLREFVSEHILAPHLRRADDPKTPVWSVILHGPPGTAKTSLARDIARALGWPLVTLGMGDFLALGSDRMAYQAARIFSQLRDLEHVVVFLDEAEEVVRVRLQNADKDDRLMTDSMLTLLQDFRDQETSLLIAATNYLQYIDQAARRPGRVDVVLTVLPPNLASKMELLRNRLASIGLDDAEVAAIIASLEASEAPIQRMTFHEWSSFLQSMSPENAAAAHERLIEQIDRQPLLITDDEWADWETEETIVNVI